MLVPNGSITPNYNISNNEGNICSLLLKSVEDERVDILRSILAQITSKSDFHEQVDQICYNGGTVLHYAVARNSVDSVRTLLSAGVNPCVQNDNNNTAYRMASSEEVKNAFVQELLQAVAQSNLGRVCQMISAGVSVDSIDATDTSNTALHWSASYGNEDVVRILCQSGANVNMLNTKNETALHDAIRRGNDAIVKCLLSYGADPSIKNKNGEDCYELAIKMGGTMLPSLSLNTLNRTVRRTTSTDSEIDRSSLISSDTTTLFVEKTSNYSAGHLENWTDLLWPQPKYIDLDERKRTYPYPKDGRLKIYFDRASKAEPRRLMQIIQMSASILSSIQLELDYRGHQIQEQSSLDGCITCGIFENGCCCGTYTLIISEDGIELYGEDHAGIRHGFSTLAQILRIFKEDSEIVNLNIEASLETLHEKPPESKAKITDAANTEQSRKIGTIPCLTIRDSPDSCFRAVYQDFSGCKILNTETLLQLATRIGYCKASHLFVNFEVRTTDRYQLPYTTRDLFQMTQICDELFVKFVPSLDVQSSYIESDLVCRTIDSFLNDFPLTKLVHFGPNLATMVISNRTILNSVQRRVPRIYISVDIDKNSASLINHLPPFVTLCIEGKYPFEAENLLSPHLNVVLRFSTSDPGFLCAAPESIAKKALLATRLGNKFPILGAMICDLSTGCEVMPPSLSYMSELASLGVCWNKSVDIKRFCFLLPRITAEHFLLDSNMEALFRQVSTVGRVEHEITRFSYGLKAAENAIMQNSETFSTVLRAEEVQKQSSSPSSNKKKPISVFVEMILNPDNMVLERLTPIIFKKARIELKRSLKILDQAKKRLPYNYELALVLAEIQFVTELMILVCKLGQSLCTYGINPSLSSNNHKTSFSSSDRLLQETTLVGYQMVNIGVSNLPPALRTDLANRLLEIRSRFQHTWLSRNIAILITRVMSVFAELKSKLDQAITGVNRYNPNNVDTLENCIEAMVQENQYDKDILVTTLKLYQLNPDKYNENVVKLILLKTMMMAPKSDYALAKYLIDSSRVISPELKRVFDIGALLESCNFAVFWRLMRGDYRPLDDVSEPFRQPGEIPKIIRAVPGFEESVRNYACQVINVTFQNIEKSLLVRLLGGISDKQVNEYARFYGWIPKENGEVYFVQNHEATIKSRNIEEKLQFDNDLSAGEFRSFDVDNRCVLPVGVNVGVYCTSGDVIQF
ncbi:ankyrin repeat protein [Onchocerca flexuosa]|uniref:Eukaryotic translation initiation factor 3 subunit K n=1 Tax=Onchocerca flexuosa TaxID=387005 RepID=A0A238BYF5_9BILA|nr:ankyrin repeat protein [Onchocerca flexuosa]